MEIFAHRGLVNGAIENSPLALKRAVTRGFSVETDFRFGLENEILVFHDDTLERLLDDSRLVSTVSASEIARLYEARTGLAEPDIPGLQNLLQWKCWREGLNLLINVKEPRRLDLAMAICGLIARAECESATYLFDMDQSLIPKIKGAWPGVRLLGRLSHLQGQGVEDIHRLRNVVDGVWFDDYYGDLLGGAAEAAVSELKVPLFYVSPELHQETHPLARAGYRQAWTRVMENPAFIAICTDFPDELRVLCDERESGRT